MLLEELKQLFERVINMKAVFHKDTTDMPMYDNMLQNPDYFKQQKGKDSRLTKITPDEYIKRVLRGFNTSMDNLMSGRDDEKIERFAKQMEEGGKKFPILTLDYTGSRLSQEGIHRALAAKKAGVTQVPVLIVNKV